MDDGAEVEQLGLQTLEKLLLTLGCYLKGSSLVPVKARILQLKIV